MNSTIQSVPVEIAIQGERGSFHELAARKFFGSNIQTRECDSFPELFRGLEASPTFGLVAIENSVAGTLLPNYALLRNASMRIVGEVYLRIAHCLMGLPGQRLEQLREVHSHPMALLQCQAFLAANPHIRAIEQADTAGSARWLSTSRTQGVGVIASARAADIYGLEIMAHEIEDNKRNFTRFLVLAPQDLKGYPLAPPNKASICFSLAHKVGGLAQVLLALSQHQLNLSKIQSLPVVGREWEYFFHIDLEFESFQHYQEGLQAIQPLVDHLQSLGEYPSGEKGGKIGG
jgi:prephenate dehydratase